MRFPFSPAGAAVSLLAVVVAGWAVWAREEPAGITKGLPGQWRSEKRVIDLHMHIDGTPERFDRAVRIMDKAGVGIGVNLSGGTVTPEKDGKSAFEKVKASVVVRWWHHPRSTLPTSDELLIAWLNQQWRTLDRWVDSVVGAAPLGPKPTGDTP